MNISHLSQYKKRNLYFFSNENRDQDVVVIYKYYQTLASAVEESLIVFLKNHGL